MRTIAKTLKSVPTLEGAGVAIRRVFPTGVLEDLDPFQRQQERVADCLDALQRPQTAARGAMLARAEGGAGIHDQPDAAGSGPAGEMAAANGEAAADALLGERGLSAGEPAIRRTNVVPGPGSSTCQTGKKARGLKASRMS